MLRSEAIAIIKRGLGFRQTQDTAIIAALKEAQRTLELGHSLPTFLLQYDLPIEVTATQPLVDLPTGFLRFHEDYQMYYFNSTLQQRVFVPRKNYREAFDAYIGRYGGEAVAPDGTLGWGDGSITWGTDTGDQVYYPKVMVQRGKTQAMLIPTPSTDMTVYLTCYIADQVLDSELENLWLKNAPDALIGMAGMTVAGNLRDKDALAEFTRRANQAGRSLMNDIVEDELAGRPLIMGRDN